MATPDPEELGTWHDATTLRAAWNSLPGADAAPGGIGYDIVYAARGEAIEWLESHGLDVPAEDAVPASHRMAQLYFARALWATKAASPGVETAGQPGYEVPATAFRRQARDQLGYGDLGIG